MKISDRIVLTTTAFLVRTILRPKVYYLDPSMQKNYLTKPCIIVSNHTSHLDGPIVNTVFRHNRIHSLAAKDRFEQRGFGFFLRHTNCIPLDRQNMNFSWIHAAQQALAAGDQVAIYPEGKHGSFRKQLPFQPGVVMLCALGKVPIVMVYIDGPVRVFGPRARLIVAPEFTLEPPEGGLDSDYIKAQTTILQDKMTALMNKYICMVEQKKENTNVA